MPGRGAGGRWRLAVATANLLPALLCVFRAPQYALWMLAVLATEWGHQLAALVLALTLPGWRAGRAGRLAAGLGLAGALLELTPLLRALPAARRLPDQLRAAFGPAAPRRAPGAAPRPAPLVAADLWRGVALPPLRPRRLAYARRGQRELALDLYGPPAGAAPAPLVLVVHGGAWRSGSSAQLAGLNRYLAPRGYAVAAINYRLAPQHPFPAARDDLLAALAFLKGRAAELGIDPQRIALLGRSAGAHLALLVAYTAGDPAIRALVGLYGPADLRYGYEHPANPAVIDSRLVLREFVGGAPDQLPAPYDEGSPIQFVGPATPPTLLVHGGRDELVTPAQSRRLAARLAAAGRPHLLLELPWATHGADANLSGPTGQLSTYAIEHFLAATL